MKQSEISKLNLKDLDAKIIELKKKLFDLKMSSYVSELENPILIRNTRRIIARLKTAKTKLNKDLIFNTMSVTSSLTPSIVENSWSTPLILIDDIAVPCNEDKSTLLRALPNVVPKPFSKGSITTDPNFLLSLIL